MNNKPGNDIRSREENFEMNIIDENDIKEMIYEIRGEKIMFDFDLAVLYGYSTKSLNQQVKRNNDKFPEDFRFQISREELDYLMRSQNVTSRNTSSIFRGQDGGVRYLPWCYTESGIYMLMTVLKGELASKQSIVLIRTFRSMKNYIIENQALLQQHDYLRLSMQVSDTQKTVQVIQKQIIEHEEKFSNVFEKLNDTLNKSEISPFMLDFSKPKEQREFLFLNGQPA